VKKPIIYSKDRKKFIKLCTQLNDLMKHIVEYNLDAYLYVSGEGTTDFNLYSDSTLLFDEYSTPIQRSEGIVEVVTVSHCDCGGF